MYHKFYNPEVVYDQWQPWDQWSYPERDILRFEHIIKNQRQHITGKRVLDVGCHLGYLSLFCCHNHASFVTGINVRDRELNIGRQVISYAGYDNFDLINSDLTDTKSFHDLCDQHDTIMLCGVIYHINDHYGILNRIYKSGASTLIVEGLQPRQVNDDPVIFWQHEKTDVPVNAFVNGTTCAFVGAPTSCWVKEAAKVIGWSVVYDSMIEYIKEDGSLRKRYIVTLQK